MKLEDLNWDKVPEHVSVLSYKTGELNFAVNIRGQDEAGSRWIAEGDECNISGDILDENQGWGRDWTLLERPSVQVVPDTSAIVEWLDKLAYVLETDTTVGIRLEINLRNQAVLPTTHGVIIGSQNVAEFINNRYSQLIEQANKAKREQLLKDVASAKEAYEAKVRELELLEKGL